MNKNVFWKIDLKLLFPVFIVVAISLITLFSINRNLFNQQLIFLLVSTVIFLVLSQVNFQILKHYSLPIYIVSLILLGGLLIFGMETRGSTRWFEFMGFRAQFSEILKPFLAVSLSAFLVNQNRYLVKPLLKTLLFIFPVAFLIFVQPDLGSALIYLIVCVLTLIYFGFQIRYFIGAAIVGGISFPLFWYFLHDYQKQRLLTFINPTKDPLGTSYNTIQAIITVGSGMIFGKGLGQGTQSGLYFLPERHTDFIFATISEDFGFFGAFVVLISFALIFLRIYQISRNAKDDFSKIFAAICLFIILAQFFLNVGMNVGIVPIVGITLPFVSYGGSSLLSNFILLGFLNAITKGSKKESIFEIR